MALESLSANIKIDNERKVVYVNFKKLNDEDRNALSLPMFANWSIKQMPKKRKGNNRYKKESEYKKLLSEADMKEFDKIKRSRGFFAAANYAESRL